LPFGPQQKETYQLTTEIYTDLIMTVARVLKLEQPVVMGCSIGGRIVLNLAITHPEEVRSVIGLQSSAQLHPYYDISWLHRPDVHGGEVCAGIVSGLIAPQSPDTHRRKEMSGIHAHRRV
jgi:pimeloyl-ACP methyl ester carboxylesterase